jgi:tripartite-type tricarboxylate transporter receptor subunit TctC
MKTNRTRQLSPLRGASCALGAAFAAFAVQFAPNASAQAFPSKTVTMVVPIATSTAFYIAIRQMADQIQTKTGRNIVLEPVLGASGTLAPARVKRSEPDGHTIGLTWAAPLTLNPVLSKDQPYDPLKDFSYIAMLTRHGIFFVAGAQFAPNNLQELIAAAKAKPGTVRFGQAAAGSRVGAIQLEEAAGVKFLEVPYKSSGQSEIAALAGEIDFFATTAGSAMGQIKAGKMKGLFIGSKNRSSLHPNVASVSETFPDLEIVSWYALYAPAGTPADRVDWHYREWVGALKDPKNAERMQNTFGYDVIAGPGSAVLEQVRRELPIHARIVKQHNITE